MFAMDVLTMTILECKARNCANNHEGKGGCRSAGVLIGEGGQCRAWRKKEDETD